MYFSISFNIIRYYVYYYCTEEGGWLSFFDYLSPFCFLLIEFHYTFSISYKIFPHYVYYYSVLIMMWYSVGTSFVRACFASFHSHSSLLTIFVCLIVLFRSCCSRAWVFGKTLVHEFPMSYSHTEWYLLFFARRNSRSFVYQNQIKLNYYYCILIGWQDFFFRASFTFFHTIASILTFCFFVLFHSYCSHSECLGKHSCMSSSSPIVIPNGHCFFPTEQLQVHNVYSEQKNRNA